MLQSVHSNCGAHGWDLRKSHLAGLEDDLAELPADLGVIDGGWDECCL